MGRAVTRLSGLFCWEAYVRLGHELEDTPELFSASLYWDTRNVTHMDRKFARGHFNGALNHLNVSRVTTFHGTFLDANDFNRPPVEREGHDRYVRGGAPIRRHGAVS